MEHFTSILDDSVFDVVDVRKTAIIEYYNKSKQTLINPGVISYPPYLGIE